MNEAEALMYVRTYTPDQVTTITVETARRSTDHVKCMFTQTSLHTSLPWLDDIPSAGSVYVRILCKAIHTSGSAPSIMWQ